MKFFQDGNGAFLQYMRAHGNTPGPTQRPVTAGLITGALAFFPAVLMLWFAGAPRSMSQSLAISQSLVLILQGFVMVMAGGLYGWIFSRAANDRRGGWLFGISYGFFLWMLGPGTLWQWIMARPIAVGRPAMGLLGANILYGLTLGLLFPLPHRVIQRMLRHTPHHYSAAR